MVEVIELEAWLEVDKTKVVGGITLTVILRKCDVWSQSQVVVKALIVRWCLGVDQQSKSISM